MRILAGDQDPVANFDEGAYHVANRLISSGQKSVRTRVYPGMRHEIHNEPESRQDVKEEITSFVSRNLAAH